MSLTAEEILAKAADLVERPGGWCRYAIATRDGAHCAMGAIGVAGDVGIWWMDGEPQWFGSARGRSVALVAAMKALANEVAGEPVPPRHVCQVVVDWNNAPEREAIEVATALRNAKRWL